MILPEKAASMESITIGLRALTLFPRIPKPDISNGKQEIKYESCIKPQNVRTSDYYLRLEPHKDPMPTWFNDTGENDLVAIILEYEVSSFFEALDTVSSFLDPIIDDLSFQLQVPITV
jgi:hypothetical protein